MHHEFGFHCVGKSITVRGTDAGVMAMLRANFSSMAGPIESADLAYELRSNGDGLPDIVRLDSDFQARSMDTGELVYQFEADLVVQLQLLRSDLFFLHSAVIVLDGNACLLVGHSGAGKSTTCWGLQHHGFEYLSDELAPIDVQRMTVHPYPHALCMKTAPPTGYPVPPNAWLTPRGVHIPLPTSSRDPLPLCAVFVVEYAPQHTRPEIVSMRGAESAVRLYPNALNPLAHSNDGMDAVARIATSVPVSRIACADLGETCEAIRSAAREITG